MMRHNELLNIPNGDFEGKILAGTGIRTLDFPTHIAWSNLAIFYFYYHE